MAGSGVKAGSVFYSVAYDRATVTAAKNEAARIGKELSAALQKALDAKSLAKPVTDALKTVEQAAKQVKITPPDSKAFDALRDASKEAAAELRRLDSEHKAGILTQDEYRRKVEEQRDAMRDMLNETTRGSAAYDTLASAVGRATTTMNRMDIQGINAAVFGLRNQLEAGTVSEAEFRREMERLINTSTEMAKQFDRNSKEFRQTTNAAGGAARAILALDQKVSMLGMSKQVLIGGTSLLERHLGNLGPAGNIASLGIAKLTSSFNAANAGGLSFMGMARSMIPMIGVGLVAAVAAGSAALTKMANDASEWAGDLLNASERLNMTAEALQGLRHAAKSANVESSALEGSLQSLTRRAAAAAEGTGPAAKVYERLGISVLDANDKLKDSDVLLGEIADAFAGLEDPGMRSAYAFDLMNRTGTALLPMLAAGSAGLAEMREEAERLGIVMSDTDLMELDAFGTELSIVKDQFAMLTREIAVSWLPYLRSDVVPFLQGTAIPVIKDFSRTLQALGTLFGVSGGQISDFATRTITYGANLAIATTATTLLSRAVTGLGAALGVAVPPLRILSLIVAGATLGFTALSRAIASSEEESRALSDAAGHLNTVISENPTHTRRMISGLEALDQATGEAGLKAAVDQLAGTLEGPGRDAFILFARQAIASGEDIQEVTRLITEELLRQQLALSEHEFDVGIATRDALVSKIQALSKNLRDNAHQTDPGWETIRRLQQEQIASLSSELELLESDLSEMVQHMFVLGDAIDYPDGAIKTLTASVDDSGDALRGAAGGVATYAESINDLNEQIRELAEQRDATTDDAERAELIAQIEVLEARRKAMLGQAEATRTSATAATEAAAAYGSLLHAQAELGEAQKAFQAAATPEGRAEANELVEYWQGVLEAINAEFASDDSLKDVRLWAGRLLHELEAGDKKPLDLLRLVTPTLDRLKDELAGLWADGLGDSDAADVVRTQITEVVKVIEAANADMPALSVFPRPDEGDGAGASYAEWLLDTYGYVLDLADAHAELNGVTSETRDAYASTLSLFEQALEGVEEGSDEWFALATAIVRTRDGLEGLDAQLRTPFPDVFGQLTAGAEHAIELLRDGIPNAITGAWGALDGLLGTTRGLRGDELMAGFLGQGFDRDAAEVKRLETEIKGLVGRYDDLTVTEQLRLNVASGQLQALRDKQEAEKAAAEAAVEATRIEELRAVALGQLSGEAIPSVTGGLAELADLQRLVNAAIGESIPRSEMLRNQLDELAETYPALAEQLEIIQALYDDLDAVEAVEAAAAVAALRTQFDSVTGDAPSQIETLRAALIALIQSSGDASGELQAMVNTLDRMPVDSLKKKIADLGKEGQTVFEELREEAQALADVELSEELISQIDAAEAAANAKEISDALEQLEADLKDAEAAAELFGEAHELAGTQADLVRTAIEALLPELGAEHDLVIALTEKWEELTEAQEKADKASTELADTLGEIGSALGSIGSATGGPMGDFISGLGEAFDVAAQFASGDIIGGVTSLVTSIISGFTAASQAVSDARKQMQKDLESLEKQFNLIDISKFTETVYKREKVGQFLFIPIYANIPETVLDETVKSIAGAVQGGVMSGFENAKQAVLAGSSVEDVGEAIKEGLRQAVIDAIWEGLLQAAIMEGAMKEHLTKIVELVAEGKYDEAAEYLNKLDDEIMELAEDWTKVLGGFAVEVEVKTPEELHKELVEKISDGLKGGFQTGMRNARDVVLAGGSAEEVSDAITSGLKQAVMDQILEGIIEAALAEGALTEHIEAIADAIARGDYETARRLMEKTGEVVDSFAGELAGVFEPFIDAGEDAIEILAASIGDSISSSLQSGFESAVQNYLDHGNLSMLTDDLEAALYTSVSNALFSAIVEQMLMTTVLESGIADIAKAIAEKDNARAAALTQSLLSVVPELAKSLEPILGVIRGAAPDSVKRGWSSNQPATPDRGNTGGVQIAEITGPSRDILVDLLSPLRGLDGLLGVQLRQLAVLESTWTLLDERLHGGPGPAPAYTGTGSPQGGGAPSITHNHEYHFNTDGSVETDFDDPDFRRDLEDLIDEYTARGLRRRGR